MSTDGCFHRLIDDAAIFPPGNAPLAQAVRDHQAYEQSAYASLVGPLLVRDGDVIRLADLTVRPLEIGVIGSVPAASPLVTVVALELPLAGDDLSLAARQLVSALDAPEGVTVSIELPRPGGTAAWIAAAEEIAGAGFQVKFRTGGVVADAYPDEAELAAVLGVLVGRPFKLTAGLHRAVRNTQPGTGFEQHGFLNVLVAVHRLLSGASVDAVADVLRDRDGAGLAEVVRSWSDEDVVAVRHTFRGFGSCSIAEPYADLVELGLAA